MFTSRILPLAAAILPAATVTASGRGRLRTGQAASERHLTCAISRTIQGGLNGKCEGSHSAARRRAMKTIISTAGAVSGAMALALMLAGCQAGQGSSAPPSPAASDTTATSPTNNPTPSPSGSVAPGHGSPAASVVGRFEAEANADWSASTGACSYVRPDTQSTCASLEQGNSFAFGHYKIETTVIQGNEALVEVTGVWSAPQSATMYNSDPTSGMPSSGADFQTVYDNLVNNPVHSVLSPQPCILVNGQWYVDAGYSQGSYSS